MSLNFTLTESEARELLEMLKNKIEDSINFPDKGKKTDFEIVGDTKKDIFSIQIFRGKINRTKYNFNALVKKKNVVLLQLHVNPGNVHTNPDGTDITGTHWHIYTEKYGRSFAIPAEDIDSELFVDSTISFLDKFNVINKPSVNAQLEMI